MYCKKCGKQNDYDANFCTNCGNKLRNIGKDIKEYEESFVDEYQDNSEIVQEESYIVSLQNEEEKESFTHDSKINSTKNLQHTSFNSFQDYIEASEKSEGEAEDIRPKRKILKNKNLFVFESDGDGIKLSKPLIILIASIIVILVILASVYGRQNSKNNNLIIDHEINKIETIDEKSLEVLINFDSNDILNISYIDVEKKLKDLGFYNIDFVKADNLSYDEREKEGLVESVEINGVKNFTKGQKFNVYDRVVINYNSIKNVKLNLKIEFTPNLFFSKYDVIFVMNGNEVDTLTNGNGNTYQYEFSPTTHSLSFVNKEDSEVKGDIEIDVFEDSDITIRISSRWDRIIVENITE